jgi:lysylphosphatidylglycerol synthetase-like protein (DUF2156 family)
MYRLYLILALVGAVFPFVILVPWAAEHGWAPGLFITQLFATRPATIFASDVLYSAAVFLLFVFVEGRRVGMRSLWLYPLVVAGIGLCCALPLFLAMRERACGRS